MTQPEKEFELKRGVVNRKGKKIYYFCPALLPGCSIVDTDEDGLTVVPTDELTEWNPDPKPKSFEDERDGIANELKPPDSGAGSDQFYRSRNWLLDLERRVRALTPDPAAAVAGSAEPVGRTDACTTREFIAGEWRDRAALPPSPPNPVASQPDGHLHDDGYYTWASPTHREAHVYLAPPSPPQPNPVGREAIIVGYIGRESAEKMAASVVNATDGPYATTIFWCKELAESDPVALYITPPTVSAAFDEAAERKLFEAIYTKEERPRTHWEYWLASAKVQRGAVPGVVSEMAAELKDLINTWPCGMHEKLTRFAAKLGGSNE